MRSIVVGLLTLLLLAGSHAHAQVPGAQVPGPIDPTGLKPRRLYINGVLYELLLPPNADVKVESWSPGTFYINDNAKPKGYRSFQLHPLPDPADRLDRAITLATGNTFRYRVNQRLQGRVEIGDRAVGVWCSDDDTQPVPEFCIGYLHHLKVADVQPPPIAQCDGVEVPVDRLTKQKRCLPLLPSPVQGFKDCPACPEMVVVPAGRFVMGSPADEP